MGKIEQIKEAIEKAKRLESKLTRDVIDSVGGFTSPHIRHLLNNLGSISNKYFEIGVHLGATFVSACYKNFQDFANINPIIFCADNFSEFNENDPFKDFVENCKKYNINYYLTIADCFIDNPTYTIGFGKGILMAQPNNIDLYLYDGNHADWAQKKAITHFYSAMANEFIFLADDYDWQQVYEGTQAGLKEMDAEILFEQTLTGTEWHNGLYIALLKKNV